MMKKIPATCVEFFRWITLLNLIGQAICLKDLRISVPEAVAVGDTVTLACYYDLENAELYSIRWYFDQEEFYRYVLKESPPARVFAIKSKVLVDIKKSSETSVTLRSVNRNQSGSYQCEVSADAPLFHTESSTAHMLVANLPESEPVLTIYSMPGVDSKRVVALGETFKASCICGQSFPAVNFTWIVNGITYPASHSGFREIESFNTTGNELKEAWSELVVHVDSHMLSRPNGRRVTVRCETNINTLYRGAAEADVSVVDDLNYWSYGGKVSPTIDQRGGNPGDPDNSALTGANKCQDISLQFIMIRFLITLVPLVFWKL